MGVKLFDNFRRMFSIGFLMAWSSVDCIPVRATGWNAVVAVKTSDKDARDGVSFMVLFQRLSRMIG